MTTNAPTGTHLLAWMHDGNCEGAIWVTFREPEGDDLRADAVLDCPVHLEGKSIDWADKAETLRFVREDGEWKAWSMDWGAEPIPFKADFGFVKATRVVDSRGQLDFCNISPTVHKQVDGLPACGQKLTAFETNPDRRDPWLDIAVRADTRESVWVPSVRPVTCKRCLKN